MEATLTNLLPLAVIGPGDVDLLRIVRNACTGTFAHHNDLISPAEQELWWAANRDHVRAWLYRCAETGALVGFGLLAHKGDAEWTTVGVFEDARGHGYGRSIVSHLVSETTGKVFGEALKSNPGGVKVHDLALWEQVYEDEDIVRFAVRGRG